MRNRSRAAGNGTYKHADPKDAASGLIEVYEITLFFIFSRRKKLLLKKL